MVGVILGGLLSIPLQIGTALLFPRVQRWLDDRGKTRAFKKSNEMRKQYEEAYYFFTYPHRMTQYFLNRGLELLRLSVFFVLTIAWFVLTPVPGTRGVWSMLSALIPSGVTLFLIFTISQSVNNLHEIYYRVEFWGEYKRKALVEMPELAEISKDERPAVTT
jgi:hypothetical protein